MNLQERYNTPDGMVLDPNGDILLNLPNLNNPDYPAVLVKIDKNDWRPNFSPTRRIRRRAGPAP